MAITNGQFGMDDGFVPREITGTWQIDNNLVQAGTQSAHPPIVTAGTTSSLSFSCGDLVHSTMTFYYNGYNPTSGQALQLFVDGVLYHMGRRPTASADSCSPT